MRSVFIFFIIFVGVHSAIYYKDQVEIPGHEGKCYDKSAANFYNEGELMKVEGGECIQITCVGFKQEVQKLRVEIFTCPVVQAGPGCTIVQDRSKPYPDCCPQLVAMPSIEPKFCEPRKRVEK